MKDIVLISNKAKSTGIGTYTYNLYDNLQKITNRDIDLLTLNKSFEGSEASVVRALLANTKRLSSHWKFLRKIPESYNIYHVVNPNLGILLPKLHSSVVTIHDIAPFVPAVQSKIIKESCGADIPLVLAMRLNMRFAKTADRIICMSNHTKKELISILGVNGNRIFVIYPGIDRETFRPRDKTEARQKLCLPPNRKILLHIGTDEPRKNTKTLIEALCLLKAKLPDVVLVKIGGMRPSTRRRIAELNLCDSVVHVSNVPNVALFYNAADALVFPSYYEGFGYPAAEAMASGCPVIAADSSSLTEVVGKGGILVPPFDAQALQAATLRVLADSKNATLVEEGLAQVEKFNWKKCAEATLGIYETL